MTYGVPPPSCAQWCGCPEVNVWVGEQPPVFKDDRGTLTVYCSEECAKDRRPRNGGYPGAERYREP